MKHLFLLILLFTGSSVLSQSIFQNNPNPSQYPLRGSVLPIQATIPFQGYDEDQAILGEGEYELFIDTVDGILDQPIIVLDGFDPGDTRDIGGLYASLGFDGDNLADILRAQGYDIVVLNAPQYTVDGVTIDGGADYIQRNAFVLVALIDEINNQKVGDAELVVLGPSMGGLIGRYALAYMEQNNLDSETRLYISFDSPHRGANIPISLQYLINYFAEQVGDATATGIVDNVLNSPAAKEMLIDHLLGHLGEDSPIEQDPSLTLPLGAPNFRDAFQAELDALGFPTDVRNVTMINGTDVGTTIGTPGMTVVDTSIPVNAVTDVEITLNFTPIAGETETVLDIETFVVGIPFDSYTTVSESPETSDGIDAAPGGTSSISNALGATANPLLDEFIADLQQDLYCFIPTMSALAIDTPDWFELPNLNDSPFENFYIPSENEDHVTVTAASAAFAIEEITNFLSVSEQGVMELATLVQNPADAYINLRLSPSVLQPVELKLYNTVGQLINSKKFDTSVASVFWEHQASSGIYMLRITSGEVQQMFKVVVK